MKLITTIGTMMMVLGFIASSVGAFPLADVSAATPIDENTPFTTEVVEQTAAQIGTMYTTIIDDLASFAQNPDLALATQRRDQMTGYATDLAGKFQLFANDLQLQLDTIADAPLPPTGLAANAGVGQITLDWNDNVEPDMNFYNVYQSTNSTGPFSLYAGGLAASAFVDAGVASGTTYYYVVTAVNDAMIESNASAVAAATP